MTSNLSIRRPWQQKVMILSAVSELFSPSGPMEKGCVEGFLPVLFGAKLHNVYKLRTFNFFIGNHL